LNTINLVRSRPNVDALKSQLASLGATHVLTYEDIASKEARSKIKEFTGGNLPRLGLNCVGGKDNTSMAMYLNQDGKLVTYGGMSKKPVELPTPL
jgi:NADPH:quinone reductase-like Zn-dependent oxidoreductase